MAYPDGEQLGTKLTAAMNAYAQYWAAPSVTPTPEQLWLARDFSIGGSQAVNRYVTIAALLNGFTDATAYSVVKPWLDAREGELIKLFYAG